MHMAGEHGGEWTDFTRILMAARGGDMKVELNLLFLLCPLLLLQRIYSDFLASSFTSVPPRPLYVLYDYPLLDLWVLAS